MNHNKKYKIETIEENKLYKIAEVASYLQVGRIYLNLALETKMIRCTKISNKTLIYGSSVIEFQKKAENTRIDLKYLTALKESHEKARLEEQNISTNVNIVSFQENINLCKAG